MKEKIKNIFKKAKPLDFVIFPIVIGVFGYAIYLKPEILVYLFVAGIFYYVYYRLK